MIAPTLRGPPGIDDASRSEASHARRRAAVPFLEMHPMYEGNVAQPIPAPTESLEFWRAFADSVPDVLLLVDAHGTILYVNHVPNGIRREDVPGRSAFEYVPAEARSE